MTAEADRGSAADIATSASAEAVATNDSAGELESVAKDRPSGAGSRFGIKTRLFLAFGSVAALTILASGVAWFSYMGVERAFGEATQRSVPAMTQALRLHADAAALAAAAPQLAAAEDDGTRQARAEELSERLAALGGSLETLAGYGADERAVNAIRGELDTLAESTTALDENVAERLRLKVNKEARVAEIEAVQAEILAILVPSIDDATFELVIAGDATTSSASDAISALVNNEVSTLRHALEVLSWVNHASSVVMQASGVNSGAELVPAREKLVADLKHIQDSLAGLADGPEKQRLAKLAAEIETIAFAEAGVFAKRQAYLDTPPLSRSFLDSILAEKRRELAEIQKQVLDILTPLVDSANFDVVIGSETATSASAEAINQLMDKGVGNLTALLQLAAETNLMAGLLGQTSGTQEEALLQPLLERYIAAASHAEDALEKLPEGETADRLRDLVLRLIDHGVGANSLFAERTMELAAIETANLALDSSRLSADLLAATVDAIVQSTELQLAERTEAVAAAIGNGKMVLGVIAGASLLVSVLIAWLYVGRNLVTRLSALVRSMREISAGNLTVEVPVAGNDEISEMAGALAIFRDELAAAEEARQQKEAEREARERRSMRIESLTREFESRVGSVIKSVQSGAQGIETIAEGMAGNMNELTVVDGDDGRGSSRSLGVADAAERSRRNVAAVASSSEELASSISEIGNQVESSTTMAANAVERAGQSNERIKGLADSVQKISQIVDLISDIAEQTNLLALNATIEAARAGEAGKGFAVVASEVKNLANQTAKATQEIAAQINEVQGATSEAVSSIEGITGMIGQISEVATTIASAVTEQRAATEEIARNASVVSDDTTHVSDSVSGLTQNAAMSYGAAISVLWSARDLGAPVDELRSAVDGFLDGVRSA